MTPIQKMLAISSKRITHDHERRLTFLIFELKGHELRRVELPGVLTRRKAMAQAGVDFEELKAS